MSKYAILCIAVITNNTHLYICITRYVHVTKYKLPVLSKKKKKKKTYIKA